jgi:hypothetical protein
LLLEVCRHNLEDTPEATVSLSMMVEGHHRGGHASQVIRIKPSSS